MDNEIVEAVLERLDAIGSTVSDAAGQGFELLVRQHIITGVTDVVWSVVFLALAITCARLLRTSYNEFRDNKLGQEQNNGRYYSTVYDWSDYWSSGPVPTLQTLGTMVGSIAFMILLTNGIKNIVNPGYYAVREILRTVT